MTTIDTVLVFTNMGNYLYLPVYELPDAKWKDMGKHVSNIVQMTQGETIVGAMPVYDFNSDEYVTVFTKNGMVKRSKLIDFKVSRYTREIAMINLQDGDTVVSVDTSNNKDVFVTTKVGYGLWYDVDSISVVGIRASGVKSIKLKDDEVVSSYLFDPNCEYITIVTDKGTAKRLKLSEIEKTSRANRGILLMKEIKSNPSRIIDSYIIPKDSELTVTSNKDVRNVKLTEIAIMDRQSNGSFISKDGIISVNKVAKMVSKDSNLEKTSDIVTDNIVVDKEYKALKNIDEKMNVIEMQLDDIEEK